MNMPSETPFWFAFYYCNKYHDHKQFGEERVYLASICRSRSISERSLSGTQGRPWSLEGGRNGWRLPACSLWFAQLVYHVSWGHPDSGLGLPTSNSPQQIFHRPTYRPVLWWHFSTEVSFSQMTLAWVKLTNR